LDIKVEKKGEVVRKYRVVHMKEFHNTYSSPVVVGSLNQSVWKGQHMECAQGMQKYF